MPSVPRLIAKHGMGCMTMYPVERVEPSTAGQRERFWDRVHAPITNQRTPFGGVDRLMWELISDEREDSAEMKTLKARAELILRKGVLHLGILTVIRFMVDACGHLQACLFDRLFRAVKRTVREQCGFLLPRRLTFHVPSYEPHVRAKIRRFIVNHITSFHIPDALRDWLSKCIGIVPNSTPSVGDVLKRGPTLLTPRIACEVLNQHQENPFATRNSFPEDFGMWVVEKLDPTQCDIMHQTVRSAVCSAMSSSSSHTPGGTPVLVPHVLVCVEGLTSKWFDLCLSLANSSGHVILRTPEQWVQLFGPTVGKLLGSNPRDRFCHPMTFYSLICRP